MVIVQEDGQLYYVLDRDLITPGNWRAILNLKVKQAYLEKREMEYIYQDGDGYVFMDTESYEQLTLDKEFVQDEMIYMKEGFKAEVTFYEGKPLSIELPATVELKVVETDPSLK